MIDTSVSLQANTDAEHLPTVAVVIPTGGGRSHLLGRSLPKLLDDPATTELIVVLDREDTPTEQLLLRFRESDPRVIVESAGRPTGLTRGSEARNRGARAARSALVLALDDDVVPARGLVTAHARRHLSRPGLVIVGYMPVVPLVQSRSAMGATARMYSASYERERRVFQRDPDAVLERFWGGHFSAPRVAWTRAIELPVAAVGYHDDADFGLRLREAGLRGEFDPTLISQHFYRRSVEALAQDALSSGRGLWNLKRTHPDWSGARQKRPRTLLRMLLFTVRSGVAWTLVSRSLVALACLTDRTRLRSLADVSVRLLWLGGVARGEHEAAAASSGSQKRERQ